jgi:TRAP-type transport system periplasmic protein
VRNHLLAAAAAALLASACTEADTPVIKLAHVGPPESLIARSAEEFARVANERLAGRARVVTYGSGQLGSDREVLQKLKLGTVDISLPSTVLSSAVPAFALFEMPYLVRDRTQLRLIEDSIFWPQVARYAEAEGYRVLALWENGFRHVTNNVRPITTPADLAGIKIRTPNSPWRVSVFHAFGANPSPMPFSEVFVALQTGVMDGQENPLTNIANASFDEVQHYLSLTGHVYSPVYVTVAPERWSRIPAEVRRVLEEVALETQDWVAETAGEIDAQLLEELRGAGMVVNEVDRAAFVRASAPVYDEFEARIPGGRAWIERAIALADEGRR